MSKNKNFFRHFFRAHEDEKIQELIQTFGIGSYGRWWILVELCAEYISNNSPKYENIECKFHIKTLKQHLRMDERSLKPLLNKFQSSFNLVLNQNETTIRILIPNLSKYLGPSDKKLEREEKRREEGNDSAESLPPKKSFSKRDVPKDTKTEPIDAKPNEIIAAYCQEYKNKFGMSPVISGKESGCAKRLSKTLSVENARNYFISYFKSDNPYYIQRAFPLSLFEQDLTKITTTEHKLRLESDDFSKRRKSKADGPPGLMDQVKGNKNADR